MAGNAHASAEEVRMQCDLPTRDPLEKRVGPSRSARNCTHTDGRKLRLVRGLQLRAKLGCEQAARAVLKFHGRPAAARPGLHCGAAAVGPPRASCRSGLVGLGPPGTATIRRSSRGRRRLELAGSACTLPCGLAADPAAGGGQLSLQQLRFTALTVLAVALA